MPPATPLDVIVRVSTPTPDVILNISDASTTTALSLKQLIRNRLEPPASTCRLRLIHAGKVLPDTSAIANVVNVTPPPPAIERSEKAKGKQPLRDEDEAVTARVYIHCSIGDPLTPSELLNEFNAATEANEALLSKTQIPSEETGAAGPNVSTTAAPRGFDRLLAAGFTAAEVATLRTQFLAIQAHTHTPDTMPSGPELLALEERWLDNTSNPGAVGTEDTGGFGAEDVGGLEDMLYGNLIGFFWPVGAMFWLMREEGVWSQRKQIAVLSGFLVNLCFGFLRIMN